jgi:hypothetical protein
MHVEPPWANMHLPPPIIDDKQGELKMTPHLIALVKQVAELCSTGLQACHCTEKFTLRQIHPLGRQEKLAFECPRLADPNRKPASGRIFIRSFYYCRSVTLI